MVRFVFRALSMLALLLAVITATMDSIQSVSSSQVMFTSFGSAWQDLDAPSLELALESLEHYVEQKFVLAGAQWTLRQPTFGVFLVLALIFWMIGYRRPPPSRFAA
jgi:hypothetical protein